ncbi:MAG: hypothetical protein DRP01_09335 [Archaeoglobales archaeon]|nr:MAG: hypothetical protein DRP01_09335 [Archaeoglobales archaeon]
MAVTLPRQVKYEVSNATELEISPEINKRKFLIDFGISTPSSGQYVDIYVGGSPILRIYEQLGDCKLIDAIYPVDSILGFWKFLEKHGIKWPLINAAQDQKLTLKFSEAKTLIEAWILEQKGGDVDSHNLPGGSDATVIPYIFWVTHSSDIAETKTVSLDKAYAPTGLPKLADGEYLDRGYRFRLQSIIFAASKSGSSKPTRLHIWLGDYEIYSPKEHKGIVVDPDYWNTCKLDVTADRIFVLPDELVIPDNILIRLLMDVTYDGTNTITKETLWLGLLGILERV